MVRETLPVRRADNLQILIHAAEGKSRPVLKQIAEEQSPNARLRPAPCEQAIGGVPAQRSPLFGDELQRAKKRVDDFARIGARPGVAAEDFGALPEGVPRGESRGAIFVPPVVR